MIEQWVKDLTEKTMGPSSMRVGLTLRHPDGRMVKITSGALWGSRGYSNFWHWREVLSDGSLSAKDEAGYGW